MLVMVLLGAVPAGAHADADPASDVLLTQGAFFPYAPAVPPKLAFTLNTVLGASARVGLPLKVAIIGSRQDLGGVPVFFGRPQKYAEFLDREISFNNRQSVLVVMPAGFGVVGAGPASALAHVPVDAGHGSAGLTRSAILAVVALARAKGHSISVPSIASGTTAPRNGPPAPLLFGVPVVLLIVIGLARLRRRKPRDPRQPPVVPPPA